MRVIRAMPEATSSPTRVRVLVVDDHEDTLDLLEQLLTPRGFEVRTANSVREARRMLAEQTPDLVVTDLEMPGEDGFALCSSVRTGSQPCVPVLALTGCSDDAMFARAEQAGFSDVLHKPCPAPTLASAVCRALVREHATTGRVDPRALGFHRVRPRTR